MRITIVSPFDPRPDGEARRLGHVGGVERVLGEFAQRLSRRGHEVTLLCSTAGHDTDSIEDGIRVQRAHRRATFLRTPIVGLAKRLDASTDLVHVAATYPFTTPPVLRRARSLGVPAVLDFHFEPAPGTPLGRIAAAAYRHLGPRAYPLADAVLVRSFAYARAAPSIASVPESRWRIVPNGVDTARFRPNGAAEGDYILFVGRLVPYKGLEVLLRALDLVPIGLPLVIVGDGPLRPRLEALARKLGVDARFLGHVRDDELPQLYRNARLTVLPSVTRQEAFGVALLESLACGTPVVASDLPGVADLAREGGLVARVGDPTSLADQLWYASEPGLLPRGADLSTRIHEKYGWETVIDRLVAAYDEVLGHRRAAPPEVNDLEDPRRHSIL